MSLYFSVTLSLADKGKGVSWVSALYPTEVVLYIFDIENTEL